MITNPKLKNKNIAVFGLGKAGRSAVHSLSKSGANVFAFDDNEQSCQALESESLPGVVVKNYNEYDWTGIDYLVLSPGVPLTHPVPHPVVLAAKNAGVPIICDVELLYMADPAANFIGITGTNGKSTTTALLGHVLQNSSLKSAVGGNIGTPVLELDELGESGNYIIEMSSYQLDLIQQTKFNIAIWLNITPDHIDRHGSIDGYVKAKERIFGNLQQTAIISIDDEYSKAVYEKIKSTRKVVPISVNEILEDGASVIDDVIYDNGQQIKLGDLTRLPGKHNAQNIAAVYAAARAVGVAADDIVKNVSSFAGLPHRMQLVAEKNGVKFVNDSKATNAEAASKSLATFDDIYWIAGGVAKDGGIQSLQEFFPKIKHAYLIGQAQDEFAKSLDGKVDYSLCETLENAVAQAKDDAKDGVVLLAPACASFDQWPNFEARGDAFCQMVG
jgi:UDP-N-acetylmuramoylalanine--D-glutamate ligase